MPLPCLKPFKNFLPLLRWKHVLNEDMAVQVAAPPLHRALQTARPVAVCAPVPLVSPSPQNCPRWCLLGLQCYPYPQPLPTPHLYLFISHFSFSLSGTSRLVQTACWCAYIPANMLLHYTFQRLPSYTYLGNSFSYYSLPLDYWVCKGQNYTCHTHLCISDA